ncbi:MAG: hypothetical protein HYX51_09000 [Chloroflexi bacterium]|nr:hypothetical protein [Chloroflexota bacterium]
MTNEPLSTITDEAITAFGVKLAAWLETLTDDERMILSAAIPGTAAAADAQGYLLPAVQQTQGIIAILIGLREPLPRHDTVKNSVGNIQ